MRASPWRPASACASIRIQPRTLQLAVLAAIIGVGVLLRFWWIADQSFWRNELFSVFWVRNSWHFLWTDGLWSETNPPLYYSLLKLWLSCFGDSELAARSLSAAASCAGIPLVYLLAREIGERRAALPAAAVMAIAPSQIFFANETRGYALIPTLVAAMLLCLFRCLRAGARRRGEGNSWLAGFVLSGAALVYVHVSSLLILATFGVAFVLFAIDAGVPRATLHRLAVASALMVLLAGPEIGVAFAQQHSPNIEWIPALNPMLIAASAQLPVFGPVPQWEYSYYAYDPGVWWQASLAVALLILVTLMARRSAEAPSPIIFLALTPLLFLVLVGAISLLRPILLPRLMVFTAVPLSIVAGMAIAGPTDGWANGGRGRLAAQRLGMAALVAGSAVVGIATDTAFPEHPKPAWRLLVPALLARVAPGDLIVTGPHAGPLALAHYAGGLRPGAEIRRLVTRSETPTAASGLEDAVCGQCAIATAPLVAAIAQGRPVWLALDAADRQAWEREGLASRFPPAAVRLEFPGVELLGWNPPQPDQAF